MKEYWYQLIGSDIKVKITAFDGWNVTVLKGDGTERSYDLELFKKNYKKHRGADK